MRVESSSTYYQYGLGTTGYCPRPPTPGDPSLSAPVGRMPGTGVSYRPPGWWGGHGMLKHLCREHSFFYGGRWQIGEVELYGKGETPLKFPWA